MTVRTVSNLPAAMHVETARCLFAIELSKESWVIGFITPLSAKISRKFAQEPCPTWDVGKQCNNPGGNTQ